MASAVLLVLLLASAGAQAGPVGLPDPRPVDLDVYHAELLQAADRVSAAASVEDGRHVAATMPSQWIVRVGDRTMAVDARWIGTELTPADAAGWPSRRARIAARLATMAAVAMPSSTGVPIENSDRALADVLARPEFRRSAASVWLHRLRERVGAWLLRALNRLTGAPVAARMMAVTFAWFASLTALAALVLWLVSALTARTRAASLELGGSMPPRTPAREWARRALAALRQGDPREAVRCGYHAALCRLEEQGIWRVDESRTPREYARLLGADDPRRDPVAELTRQFEQIWYGRRPATAGDAERLSANLERLGCLHAADRTI